MRFIHLIVVATLVAAAVDVYKIKFEATVQAERVARLRAEIAREHETTATLRAEWAQLDNPARIQALAQRHLSLKPFDPAQVETLDHVPERPPAAIVPPPEAGDAIADAERRDEGATGSTQADPPDSIAVPEVSAGAAESGPIEVNRAEAGSVEAVPPVPPTAAGGFTERGRGP
jgi:hypothetical protein